MSLRVVVEADGGARGNPGPAGWGAVVKDADSGDVLLERSAAIGTATNNVAEYQGVINGLAAAAELGADLVEVRMDSKLVVEQMTGRWQIKHPGLRPLAAQVAGLVRRFQTVTWQWIPRAQNSHADRLANQAMDTADRPGHTSPSRSTTAPAAGAAAKRIRSSWDPPDTPPTRLILVRHGATDRTAEGRYSGRVDVPLSAAGTAQAQALGQRIAQLAPAPAAVVSSPLQRCTATAAQIAAATGNPPITTSADLIECDLGEWEGLTFAEVRERWPDQLAAWHTSTSVAPPGGESLQQVANRVRRAGAGLRDAYPAATVVVVSHVWPLKLWLRDALAAGDTFLQRLLLAPAGLSLLDTYPDGIIAVHTVNDTTHLADPNRPGSGGGGGPDPAESRDE